MKKLIGNINALQGGSPWKFMPEYLIEVHIKDLIRIFRVLDAKITEKNDWTLEFENENYIQEILKIQ